MTESLVATGLRALVRSRLLIPPGPTALLRIGREVARGRTNLATLLGMGAARWPDRAAMIDDEGAISYRELLLCTREHSPMSCNAAAAARGTRSESCAAMGGVSSPLFSLGPWSEPT